MQKKEITPSESEPVWLERVASIPVANIIILTGYGVYRIVKEAIKYTKKNNNS